MRIVDPGNDRVALQVDPLRGLRGQREDLRVAADREDALTADRQCLCVRLGGVGGEDPAVVQDQVGRGFGLLATAAAGGDGQQGEQAGEEWTDVAHGSVLGFENANGKACGIRPGSGECPAAGVRKQGCRKSHGLEGWPG